MGTQKRVLAASGVVLILAGVCAMPRAAAGQGIWAKKADLPTPRFMMSACTVDGRIYVVGGFSPAGSSLGSVWDGSSRILYVDGVEVSRDAQASLAASAGGLHLGAGCTLAPGTFRSGLIDDVRLYDRAVQP